MKPTFGSWDWFSWHSGTFVIFPLPLLAFFYLPLYFSLSLTYFLDLGARRMALGNIWVRRKPASCSRVL